MKLMLNQKGSFPVLIILGVVLVLVITFGIYFFNNQQNYFPNNQQTETKIAKQQESSSSTVTSSVNTNDWQIGTDAKCNISFKYPKDWSNVSNPKVVTCQVALESPSDLAIHRIFTIVISEIQNTTLSQATQKAFKSPQISSPTVEDSMVINGTSYPIYSSLATDMSGNLKYRILSTIFQNGDKVMEVLDRATEEATTLKDLDVKTKAIHLAIIKSIKPLK